MLSLYLVALLPPEPVLSEVWALKQEVHRLTGSRNAIKLPAHITLIPPLRQSAEFEDQCTEALTAFAAQQATFEVSLRDFAWFGDRTLFVYVSAPRGIQAFHAALETWCAAHLPQIPQENRPYTPHMTLATRDLPAGLVPALQARFAERRYEATFTVRSFHLFRHNGQQWLPLAEFALNAAKA